MQNLKLPSVVVVFRRDRGIDHFFQMQVSSDVSMGQL